MKIYEYNSISFLKIKEKDGGAVHMKSVDIPVWEKYTLTIEEASAYFRIGEKKLVDWLMNIETPVG